MAEIAPRDPPVTPDQDAYLSIGLWTYKGTARRIEGGNAQTFRFHADSGVTPLRTRDFVTRPVRPDPTH